MTLTITPTEQIRSAVDAWEPPSGHRPHFGSWTPFLQLKWTELTVWSVRNDVFVTFTDWTNGWFGAYNDLSREIRLHETLTPRHLVSTFAHESIHAARGAYGFGWKHQEDQADEGAVALLVDPVTFAAAELRHSNVAGVDSYGVRNADRLVGRDLEISVNLLPAARRLWSSSVHDRLDHLSDLALSESEHRQWLRAQGIER